MGVGDTMSSKNSLHKERAQTAQPRCVFHPKIPCPVRAAMREAGIVAQHIELPKTQEEGIIFKVMDVTAKIAAFEWSALASFCHQCTKKQIQDNKLMQKAYPTLKRITQMPPARAPFEKVRRRD